MSAFSVATGTALLASAKSAIDFQDDFAGVEKTVNGTAEEMAELKQGIRDMAKEIPSTTTEISAVAEAAGQLGIEREHVLSFTKTMIDMGNATNLSAEEAATTLARFANVTRMSKSDFSKLGSVIVELGNNFATTEAEIAQMGMNLASAGTQVGMSQSEIMALATALSSVGLEAQAGGTAFSKVMVNMQLAVEKGGESLEDFANVAGMSAQDFKDAFQKDATKAIMKFIEGLSKSDERGKSAIKVLDDMGIKETRLRDALLRSANASDIFSKAIELGNHAWEDNTALTNEANKRYDTLKSKIQIAVNKLKDIAITIGNKLMPYIEKLIKHIENLAGWFSNLSDEQVEFIMNIGLAVTAITPFITAIGKITSVAGGAAKGVGTVVQAIGVARGKIESTEKAVNGLAKVFSTIGTPAGLTVTAITLVAGAAAYLARRQTDAQKETQKLAEEMKNAREEMEEYNTNVDNVVNSNIAQIENSEKLRDELSLLVDENGKVKDGYKSRVDFILKQLNGALGTEYKLTGDIVEEYKDLQKEIDSTIKKKKAQIILNGEEEKYKNAIENQEQAVKDLAKAQDGLNGQTIEMLKTRLKIYEETGFGRSKDAEAIRNQIQAYEDAEYRVKEYTQNIKQYESDYEKFVEGNYDSISNKITNTTQDWCDKSLEEINKNIAEQSNALDNYKKIYENTGNEISLQQEQQAQKNLQELAEELKARTNTVNELTPQEIEAWKTLATGSYNTYYDTISGLPEELGNKIQEMTGVTIERTPELVAETQNMANQLLEQIEKNPEFKQEAISNLKSMLNGFRDDELRNLLWEAGIQDVDQVMKGIREGNLSEQEAINLLKSLNEGLNNSKWQNALWQTARGITKKLTSLFSFNVIPKVNGNVAEGVEALPGHRTGLDYVPKDDYVARLHKGERVLTKEENKEYTEDKKEEKSNIHNSRSARYSCNINVYCNKLDENELNNIFNYINRRFGAEY